MDQDDLLSAAAAFSRELRGRTRTQTRTLSVDEGVVVDIGVNKAFNAKIKRRRVKLVEERLKVTTVSYEGTKQGRGQSDNET